MANLEIPENPQFETAMTKIEVNTPVHADIMNTMFQQLLTNELFLKDKIEIDIGNKPQQMMLTIPTTGWVASAGTGTYTKKVEVAVTGIKTTDVPEGNIALATETAAQDCGLSVQCESSDGKITFYAKSVPTVNITYNYIIIEGV